MFKNLVAGLALSLFLLSSPVQAKHDPEGVCTAIAMSMINIPEDADSGTTEEAATQWYLDYLAARGFHELNHFQKRVLEMIKVVHSVKPLNPKTLEPVVIKEYELCLSIHGDYSKLQTF